MTYKKSSEKGFVLSRKSRKDEDNRGKRRGMNYGTESKAASASYGIWNYILKLMPKPEQNEATTMIGRTLLATNEVRLL